MGQARRTSLIVGVLFILTFITAIVGYILYDPVLNDVSYITGPGSDGRVALGALLEMFLIITNIGTAVFLYPVLRRQDEALSLSYVAARLVECTFIAIGIVALLAIVTLRRDASGEPATLVTTGASLVAVHDRTFLLGPGFIVGLGNGLILGYLMYTSGLVPKGATYLGLIGGPLLCFAGILVLFDVIEPGSRIQGLATIPEILWEAFLGIYLTFKGFRASPILSDPRPVPAMQPG